MWKQKGLVVGLCLMLFAVGLWRNGQAWQAGAEVLDEKRVAITFDDGPHHIYTEQLLDGLKERGVRATFFLIGENIEYNEALVQRMAEEGHLIGNHTFSHTQLTRLKVEEACSEVEKTDELIYSLTGQTVEYLRPPYGSWNEALTKAIPLNIALWNVDPQDWKSQDTEKVVKAVESHVGDGSVILLHDIFDSSVEAALRIIDDLMQDGYTFVTVDELLLD